uniref:FH1/FH2 domain-containing protein 1 n=1 Tax=Sphaerodactylus townsendi TaxID=933632 RepID=A0ACB8EBK1_9SAUR
MFMRKSAEAPAEGLVTDFSHALRRHLEDCTLQVLPLGNYLDLELSLLEQKDELEGFYEDIRKGRRPILLIRTQLSVRVHAILGESRLVLLPFPLF